MCHGQQCPALVGVHQMWGYNADFSIWALAIDAQVPTVQGSDAFSSDVDRAVPVLGTTALILDIRKNGTFWEHSSVQAFKEWGLGKTRVVHRITR